MSAPPFDRDPRGAAAALDGAGVVAVRGADARKFLQGQLSQDVIGLPADRVRLAGLHTPQGRVVAVLRLVPDGPTDVLLVTAADRAGELVSRLRRFVLRAKVSLTDESSRWSLEGRWQTTRPGDGAAATAVGALHVRDGDFTWLHDLGTENRAPRWLTLRPVPAAAAVTASAADAWRLDDVRAGLPVVTGPTSEAFVAQMLNLDVLEGIAFDKGCYTGQEVIARAHYRGRVKRRMQRFRTSSTGPVSPGQSVQLSDGRRAHVVAAALEPGPDGAQQFLAVCALAELDTGGESSGAAAGPAEPVAAGAELAMLESQSALDTQSLELPYALPT